MHTGIVLSVLNILIHSACAVTWIVVLNYSFPPLPCDLEVPRVDREGVTKQQRSRLKDGLILEVGMKQTFFPTQK